jgi:hypothetical protein
VDITPYIYANPGDDWLPLYIEGSRVGLLVPERVAVSGIAVIGVAERHRAVHVDFHLRLEPMETRYLTERVTFSEVTASAIKENPELLYPGVMETWDIDFDMIAGLRWDSVRRQALEEIHFPVLIADGDENERETTLFDKSLKGKEIVLACWLECRLKFSDRPNTVIAKHLGISSDAAAQRVRRAVVAGLLPPLRHGQRKNRP